MSKCEPLISFKNKYLPRQMLDVFLINYRPAPALGKRLDGKSAFFYLIKIANFNNLLARRSFNEGGAIFLKTRKNEHNRSCGL